MDQYRQVGRLASAGVAQDLEVYECPGCYGLVVAGSRQDHARRCPALDADREAERIRHRGPV